MVVHIGVDLGGTKIEIIALDGESSKVLFQQRIDSPQHHYNDTIKAICSLVSRAEMAIACSATIGIGIPGSIGSHNKVKNSNSVWINSKPLLNDLSLALNREVRVANDANCFAVSEAIDGAGKGKQCVFGVIIGTGCGGGIVVNGKPITGLNGLTGEWGHNPLPFAKVYNDKSMDDYFDTYYKPQVSDIYQHKAFPIYASHQLHEAEYPGPLCYCGKRGCLETWISGTGFQNDHARVFQQSLTAPQIIESARNGNVEAQQSFDRYCERLAKSLAQVINIVDPDIIVLGGGMSNIDELYTEIPQRWQRYIFSDTCDTPIVPAMYGDASGVRGAAWLWNESY